jgi:CheY-like chemotaxis protein
VKNTMPGHSILVVDDDPAIRATVAEILEAEGYTIRTASNGREALELVEQDVPHVVLLDMQMPVLDGWGFARAVRPLQMGLQILVMTAAQDARRWAAEIEAAGYVPKPFNLTQLLAQVERLCSAPLAIQDAASVAPSPRSRAYAPRRPAN